MLVFEERGKSEYPEKNLSEQRREPPTNSTHIWRWRQHLKPGHIDGRQALSPLGHPLLPRKPCHCWCFTVVLVLFSVAVASLTHLFVICHHFFCAMSLFQGHVTCQYIYPDRLCTTSAKTCWNYLPYKPSLIPPSMLFWIHSTLGFRPKNRSIKCGFWIRAK